MTLIEYYRDLLKQRHALKDLRFGYIYGQSYTPVAGFQPSQVPPYLAQQFEDNTQRLLMAKNALITYLVPLFEKLPECEECPEKATHRFPSGPFLCRAHAAEHPTAQEVPWAKELEALTKSLEQNPGLVTASEDAP